MQFLHECDGCLVIRIRSPDNPFLRAVGRRCHLSLLTHGHPSPFSCGECVLRSVFSASSEQLLV